jgi:hypothetical protein
LPESGLSTSVFLRPFFGLAIALTPGNHAPPQILRKPECGLG